MKGLHAMGGEGWAVVWFYAGAAHQVKPTFSAITTPLLCTIPPSQALHNSEAGGAASAGSSSERDREARVGRLQRQKVRVSRKRILESAIKVGVLWGAIEGDQRRQKGSGDT